MKSKKIRKSNNDHDKPAYFAYAKYSGLVFQMGFIIAIFTYGGYKLDEKLELTFPAFLTTGLFLGIFIGMYLSIKDFIKKK